MTAFIAFYVPSCMILSISASCPHIAFMWMITILRINSCYLLCKGQKLVLVLEVQRGGKLIFKQFIV